MVTGSGVDVRITSSTDTRNPANSWTLGIANEGTSRLKSCCIIMKLDDWYFSFTNWVYISPYFNLSQKVGQELHEDGMQVSRSVGILHPEDLLEETSALPGRCHPT